MGTGAPAGTPRVPVPPFITLDVKESQQDCVLEKCEPSALCCSTHLNFAWGGGLRWGTLRSSAPSLCVSGLF